MTGEKNPFGASEEAEGMFSLRTAVDRQTARQMNPVVLAFVGDAVYSLYVREKLCLSAGVGTGELQRRSVRFVSARGQNEQLDRIAPLFTEEESDIFRRARNARKGTRSKSATVAEYNRSTGFEAVLGFLYITGQIGRIDELLDVAESGNAASAMENAASEREKEE